MRSRGAKRNAGAGKPHLATGEQAPADPASLKLRRAGKSQIRNALEHPIQRGDFHSAVWPGLKTNVLNLRASCDKQGLYVILSPPEKHIHSSRTIWAA
ncbi:MAG: hypothetical protein ABR913_00795 [Sedimentisphaerales bacterium]